MEYRLKVNHTQNSVTTELKVNSAPNKISIDPDPVATILYVDRWGMLSETNGGAATAMDMAITLQAKVRPTAAPSGSVLLAAGASCK